MEELLKLIINNSFMYTNHQKLIIAFSSLYLIVGGIYFLRDLNHEFVIYVAVIVAIFALVFGTVRHTRFPNWMLWMLSVWGLMHVLGGSVSTPDGVLFAYRIYPFMDHGGEMYILKYDQVVHAYLYGLVALMSLHMLRAVMRTTSGFVLTALAAVLISVGISSLNEIMEFIIAISLERNGVGGYENAMLDFVFNLSGAVVAILLYSIYGRKRFLSSTQKSSHF